VMRLRNCGDLPQCSLYAFMKKLLLYDYLLTCIYCWDLECMEFYLQTPCTVLRFRSQAPYSEYKDAKSNIISGASNPNVLLRSQGKVSFFSWQQ
jgi:hypothetical protein